MGKFMLGILKEFERLLLVLGYAFMIAVVVVIGLMVGVDIYALTGG